jgi:cellobiose phosphorylase
VIANPDFGSIVSERGSTFTWSQNSREHRLTTWNNDPVIDPTAECVYLRDEASNATWSPTPHPMGVGEFLVRHGFGYSTFASTTESIASDLEIFVDAKDTVKIFRLRLRNTGDTPRRLTATFYAELAMGVFREQTAPFITTSFDPSQGVFLAKNTAGNEFANRVAFVAADTLGVSVTGDRKEFMGRNSDLSQPLAMGARRLSGTVGGGKDPCAAMRRMVELKSGESKEIFFLIGDAPSQEEAVQTVMRYRTSPIAERMQAVKSGWHQRSHALQLHTPSPHLDVLANGWLIYQALSCRIWARSAEYQPGGAYGFRDQLQDVAALVYAEPKIAREHLLRAAGRQFIEGDVQHWWHPPTGKGIRTRISDNYLWLPFIAHHYVTVTGDTSVLDENVPFLNGQPIPPDQDTVYEIPQNGPSGSLYEHCRRALDRALDRLGERGLPLMGDGDWNDGMDLVGHGGKGESVWLGWFLVTTLNHFAEIADSREDASAKHWRESAQKLMAAIDQSAWDGSWYLRAFFDDGTPLGSKNNPECSIDAIAQAWSVLAGGPNQERLGKAMSSIEGKLVNEDAGLIRLLSPPFDTTDHNPGYIKGYVPGIRENGGQYTHGAIWAIWAIAQQGDHDRAMELFDLINPVLHSNKNPDVYRVEPYVAVGDIYDTPGLEGRGGWTWYTGSAGWLYRLCIELFCGLQLRGNSLTIEPHIPSSWDGFAMDYRFGSTTYRIEVNNPDHIQSSKVSLLLDGKKVTAVKLVDDGTDHAVVATIGNSKRRQ